MLVQAHLEHAPTDEAWLAKVRARAADRAGSEWRRKAEEELFRRWAELAETEGLELLLRGERQRRFRRIVDDWPVLPEPGAIRLGFRGCARLERRLPAPASRQG
jgi:hypothetical protein